MEVNVLNSMFYKSKPILTFALDPILLSLHLVKWCVGPMRNSTCHLSVSGTFPVLQVPRLRAAFPVFLKTCPAVRKRIYKELCERP